MSDGIMKVAQVVARRGLDGYDFVNKVEYVVFDANHAGTDGTVSVNLERELWESMGEPDDVLITVRASDD